jgi:hypothetical protein
MSRKRRRTKGMGSVYTRKDGRVVGEYDVNGKTRYIYGKDEAEVANRVAEANKHRDAGIDSENMTVGGYIDRWLTAIRDTMRVGTWKQYEMIVRLHIKPTLGDTKLDRLNILQQVASILTRPRLDAPSAKQTGPLHRPYTCIMRCGSRPLKPAVTNPVLLPGETGCGTLASSGAVHPCHHPQGAQGCG